MGITSDQARSRCAQPGSPVPVTTGTQPSWVDRNFTRLLLAIAAAGLIPCLFFGQYQFIDPDGWWHLFTALQDRWINLLREWKYVAHPPLFYLLLRFVAQFGHARLILRSIGILSGCVGTYFMGVIAARIYRYKASALLVAAAYTLAWNMIEIHCEVRAYALALAFVLLAFNAYIDFVADPAGGCAGRAIVRFGVCSLLAILSEYCVVFFLVGCLCLLILRVLAQSDFRGEFLRSIRLNWKPFLFSGASILILFLTLFLFHLHVQAQWQWQHGLEPYLWNDNSPLGLDGFLLSNLETEIGYFTPFNVNPDVMLALAGLVLLPALIYFGFVRHDRWRAPASADPPLMLGILLAELVVLSLAGRYPFGGHWRQQSIIAPFVFLTVFLLLDRLAGACKEHWARNALFTGAALAVAASFAFGWPRYPWNSVELKTAEYAQFHAAFPSPEAIYADVFPGLFYYAQNHRSKWTLIDRFVARGQAIVVYRVDDGSGHSIRFLRNRTRFLSNLLDPESYRLIADILGHEGIKSTVVFYEGVAWDAADARMLEDNCRKLAPLAGLEFGRHSIGPGYAFIEFTRP